MLGMSKRTELASRSWDRGRKVAFYILQRARGALHDMFSFREHARRGSSPAVFVGAEESSPVGACNVRAVRMIAKTAWISSLREERGET